MPKDDHHYQMLTKALIWGAALFLASLGWFMPPGNTHYLYKDDKGQIRAIDMISASGKVKPEGSDLKVAPEVVAQSEGKGLSLLIGAFLVTVVWAALVVRLNQRRSAETDAFFPARKAVYWIVGLGSFSYLWFILNIVDALPWFLGGQG